MVARTLVSRKKREYAREYTLYSLCIPSLSDSLRCWDTYHTHRASVVALRRSSFTCLLKSMSISEHLSKSRALTRREYKGNTASYSLRIPYGSYTHHIASRRANPSDGRREPHRSEVVRRAQAKSIAPCGGCI